MSIATASDLVESIRQTGLLDEQHLSEVASLQAQIQDPKALARELVQRGWLTAYQVNQIFAGKGHELNLGQYLLLERLGQGGMGQVFKAKHRSLRRVVALKVIRKERLESPDAIRRFRREMHAVAQLSHPNFIHAFDADEVDGTHFIVMEYYEGIDLGKLVKLWGPLPVPLACEYIRQSALGLQHASVRNLVHRDIKPSNLLVTYGTTASGTALAAEDSRFECPGAVASGQASSTATVTHAPVIKILDMGLARVQHPDVEESGTLTKEGAAMGTPDYISPEQARDSHNVDIRSDLYSLGCSFYYLLAGQVPFPGGTLTSKLVKHQRSEAEPIESLRPDVPPGVVNIIRKLMAKDPTSRHQTPAELADALAVVLSVIGAPSAGSGPSSAVALGSGVGIGSDAGVGTGSLFGMTSTPPPPPMVPPPAQEPGPDGNQPQLPLQESMGWSSMLLNSSSSTNTLNSPRKLRKQLEEMSWRKSVYVGIGMLAASVALIGFLLWLQSASTSGPTPIRVQVAANRAWQDSHIDVSAGTPITIHAEGFWQKKQVSYSAGGLKHASRLRAATTTAPFMCLLVRIGDDKTPIGIERDQTITPKQAGRLFFQANDRDLNDNSGSLTVTVEGGKRNDESAPEPPPLYVAEAKPALIIQCGKGNGGKDQEELLTPGYGYRLEIGNLSNGWPASSPKTHCWFGEEVQFDITVPARTAGMLRLLLLDGDNLKRKQKLFVQGKLIEEYEDFGPPGEWAEVPISAEDSRRIEVKLKQTGPHSAVISTVEFIPDPGR